MLQALALSGRFCIKQCRRPFSLSFIQFAFLLQRFSIALNQWFLQAGLAKRFYSINVVDLSTLCTRGTSIGSYTSKDFIRSSVEMSSIESNSHLTPYLWNLFR